MKVIPSFVLWAWERPEDLRFINPNDTAVAFLANTIRLHLQRVIVRPRLQPLMVPEGTKLIAVVRIEADSDAAFDDSQITDAVAAILSRAVLPRVVAVQIDFDTARSRECSIGPFFLSFVNGWRRRYRSQSRHSRPGVSMTTGSRPSRWMKQSLCCSAWELAPTTWWRG